MDIRIKYEFESITFENDDRSRRVRGHANMVGCRHSHTPAIHQVNSKRLKWNGTLEFENVLFHFSFVTRPSHPPRDSKSVLLSMDHNGLGDVWTFVALDRETKVTPSFIVGKRDLYHARAFMEDLAGRVNNRVQLSSDALAAYTDAVERGFGCEVDYGQIVKTYSVSHLGNFKEAAARYSPAAVVQSKKTVVVGLPDVTRICTSHIEKQNHTIRMHCRRLSRLTNAFSKKIENFKAAIALHFAYYNFCKIHGAIRCTPAQAASVEQSIWTVAELVERCGE